MLLSIKDLKTYFNIDGEITKAVDGIDLEVGENEIVGLVGESGSGKTVTALSIMRLLLKRNCTTEGKVLFHGKNLLESTEKEILDIRGSKIGMIFQEPFTSLNPVLTVGEQIDEVLIVHKRLKSVL